jgi:type IV fimbrial biogenesis protein FimT
MNSLQKKHPTTRGLTLVELAITLAIVAVLAALAIPSFSQLIERQRLVGAAVQLAGDVQFVRSESVLRNEPLRLSFYTTTYGTCYLVHSGERSACACAAAAGAATCTGTAAPIKTVAVLGTSGLSVQANVASIRFDPLHGTGTPTGTLRVVSARAGSIHHVVNLLGRVRSCSPTDAGTAVPGYRPC